MFYCSRCHQRLATQQPKVFLNQDGESYEHTLDWCDQCGDVVETTQYGIPPWTIVATLGLLCWVQNWS